MSYATYTAALSNVVAHFGVDESSGNFVDVISGHTLTPTAGTTTRDQAGTVNDGGDAAALSSGAYLLSDISDDFKFLTNDWAVSFVFKSPTAGLDVLFAVDTVWLGVNSSGKLIWSTAATGTATVNDGAWHRVTATRVSGVISFYLDGSTTPDFTVTDGGAYTAAGRVSFGALLDGSFPYPMTIDDVVIMNGSGLSGSGSHDLNSAGLAAGYSVASPAWTTISPGVQSANFTITPTANFTGTITPGDGGAGGTFTPASLTWTGDTAAKTFKYTPAVGSLGAAATISFTNNGGLTDASSIPVNVRTGILILDGNSLSAIGPNVQNDMAVYLGSAWSIENYAVSGQTTAQMQSDYAAQIAPRFNPFVSRCVLHVWEITNDLFLGATATQATTHIEGYITSALGTGFEAIAGTCTPREDSGTPVTFEADRQTVNGNLRTFCAANSVAVADYAGDARIGDAGDNNDATYYSIPGPHMTTAGYQVVADILYAKMFATPASGLLLSLFRSYTA